MTVIMIGAVAGILYLLQLYVYRMFWSKAVEVKIEFEEPLVKAGDRTILSEVVENRKWLPLPAIKVKFQCSGDLQFMDQDNSSVTDMYYRSDLFYLMPYRRITRRHEIVCPRRGYYGIRGIDLVGTDLFLAREMLESRQSETHIHVVPAPYATPEIQSAVQKISGEVLSKRHLVTDPFAYRGIREYTPFDDVKWVNWKASAKSEEWKVNVYDYTAVSTVSIYMNLEDGQILKQEYLIEKSISISAYLAEVFLARGIGVSLYANAKDCIHKNVLRLENNRDKGQVETIYRSLARIDLRQATEPFFQCFEEQLMTGETDAVIIISPDRHAKIQDLLVRLKEKRELIWLCPCRKSEGLEIRNELQGCTMLIPEKG